MELIIESIVEALCDKTAGKVVAILDKTAGGVEAILEAADEEADEVIETEETFIELIVEARLEAAGEIFRIKAASRHTIVFRPSY